MSPRQVPPRALHPPFPCSRVTTIYRRRHQTSVNYSFHTICSTFWSVIDWRCFYYLVTNHLSLVALLEALCARRQNQKFTCMPCGCRCHARTEGPAGRDRHVLGFRKEWFKIDLSVRSRKDVDQYVPSLLHKNIISEKVWRVTRRRRFDVLFEFVTRFLRSWDCQNFMGEKLSQLAVPS